MTDIVNFKELVDMTTELTDLDLTKAQVEKVMRSMLQAELNALQSGKEIRIVGYRTMKVVSKEATTGRNPQTGASIDIPARKVAKVTIGKAVKDAVNQ
ncbi:HU family DNA-binding protein [Gammaproteobacteria bacterium]|nr:HU family DNA-binding protein [Gammaproteobacteria bacterium]